MVCVSAIAALIATMTESAAASGAIGRIRLNSRGLRAGLTGNWSGGTLSGRTVAAAAWAAARSRSSVVIIARPPRAACPARPARGTWWI